MSGWCIRWLHHWFRDICSDPRNICPLFRSRKLKFAINEYLKMVVVLFDMCWNIYMHDEHQDQSWVTTFYMQRCLDTVSLRCRFFLVTARTVRGSKLVTMAYVSRVQRISFTIRPPWSDAHELQTNWGACAATVRHAKTSAPIWTIWSGLIESVSFHLHQDPDRLGCSSYSRTLISSKSQTLTKHTLWIEYL